MAIFFDAPVEPDALTTFVRETPTPAGLRLTQLFGGPVTTNNNSVTVADIVRTNRTARFRSFDGRLHVSQRDTGSERTLRLPPLSSSLSMGEYERLQLEFARTAGTNVQALANAVYDDAAQLTREVQNRMEQAIGDAITDGKVTINENGFMSEADFGVPANHIITAGTVWTNAAAPMLDNLIAWVDIYIATNGFPPGAILTSTARMRNMATNTQLINTRIGAAAGRTRLTRDELNDILSSESLPPLLEPFDEVVDVDGVSTKVIPEDRVIFLPPNPADLLDVRYGITATALELVNAPQSDLSFEQAPGIVGVVIKDGPPFRQWTFVDAVGMPVIPNPRLLMVADVA
jgi:hypothetical protein